LDTPSRANILEPLKVALALEEEGRKFFAEAAARVRNAHARQTLEFLAGEETKHIERIKEFYRSIESGTQAPEIVSAEPIAQRVKAFNDHLATLRAEINASASDVEAYTMAVKFENGAADFYREQKEASSEPPVRAFYQWLIDEESLHSEVLSSCLLFIQDPTRWFQQRQP
jgi:rubrerythrin